jgi:hypothetical protein
LERLAKLRGWDRPDKAEIAHTGISFILPPGVNPEGTEFEPD